MKNLAIKNRVLQRDRVLERYYCTNTIIFHAGLRAPDLVASPDFSPLSCLSLHVVVVNKLKDDVRLPFFCRGDTRPACGSKLTLFSQRVKISLEQCRISSVNRSFARPRRCLGPLPRGSARRGRAAACTPRAPSRDFKSNEGLTTSWSDKAAAPQLAPLARRPARSLGFSPAGTVDGYQIIRQHLTPQGGNVTLGLLFT